MTKEDIIRMVRKASNNSEFTYVPELNDDLVCIYIDELEKFAKLVAKHEREACAKIAENMGPCGFTGESSATAIRARGQA